MALPILVLLVNWVRAIMMMMLARTVTMVSLVMRSWPPNRTSVPILMTLLKLLGFAPQMSSAIF